MDKRGYWLAALVILGVVFAMGCQGPSGPVSPTPVEQSAEPKSAESVEPSTEPTVIFTPTAEPEVEALASFPFGREIQYQEILDVDEAFFHGKEEVTMRLSPAAAQTNLPGCCRDYDHDNPDCVESSIGVFDPVLVEGDIVTLYGYISDQYPSTQVPPLSAWVRAQRVYKDGVMGWGALGILDKTGHISQLHPGWNALLLVAGYLRSDPSAMSQEQKQALIKASMAGAPPDEVLVEGYMHVSIYVSEPPDTTGFTDHVVLGEAAVVEDDEFRYIIDARDLVVLEDRAHHLIEAWKVGKDGALIAYHCMRCTPDALPFEGILPVGFTDGTVLVYDVVGLPAGYIADYLKIQREQVWPHQRPVFGSEEFEAWWKLGPSGKKTQY
jgi:hypothetical protein